MKMLSKASVLGLVLASLTLADGAARAGQITDLQLYDGTGASPVVTVTYTNPNGTGSNTAETWADPQVSSGTTAPLFYCIDLWHDNYLGSTYTITPTSSIPYQSSTFTDVDNRLAWLVNQAQNTIDERAAVQLAIWYTVDNKGFSFTGGDSTLVQDYNNLIQFSTYNANVDYSATLWAATRDPGSNLYQDLISAGSVPEPGSFVLGAMGLSVGFLAYWRRKRIDGRGRARSSSRLATDDAGSNC